MSKNKLSFIYPLLLLLAAMIWGVAFTAQDLASGVGAFTIGAVRNFFATIFLFCVIIVYTSDCCSFSFSAVSAVARALIMLSMSTLRKDSSE